MVEISVCLPSYNGEKYIVQQIESILVQLGVSDELIISDDSSSDNTIRLVESFNDPRIVLLKNNRFKSPIFNLENALKHVRGKFIFLADQDDIWIPNRIERVKEHLFDYGLVVNDCSIVSEDLKVLHDSYFKIRGSGPGFLKNLYKNTYLGCCIALRRDVLQFALPFPEQIPMHDMWLGLITETKSKVLFLNEVLVKYRRHSNNVTQLQERFKISNVGLMLKYRWNIIRYFRRFL